MKNKAVDITAGWPEEEINALKLKYLHEIFSCNDALGVNATIAYARYISDKINLNPDNYPIFMLLLESGNHWVIDALIGDTKPEIFFKPVQLNGFLLKECFKILTKWKRNGIYPKSLLVIFGLLDQAYSEPTDGYRLYPLSITDINNLGKHLDETRDQTYPINKTILSILDKIAHLMDPGNPPENQDIINLATQANNIRGKFLDMTKKLNEAIPDLLLEKGDYTSDEVSPGTKAQ
jgi:hypothetical protein